MDFDPTERLIIDAYRGSLAHNLYIPPDEKMSTDDIDIIGVFVSPLAYYFGLKTTEVYESFVGEEDIVCYDILKAGQLLYKCNPNIMSVLWNREDQYRRIHPAGHKLIDNRNLFLSKEVFYTFGGYAASQMKKMQHGACQGYMGAKRKKIVEEFGYDTKNASHLIRLLRMGAEILSTGEVKVYRTADRQQLLDIKQGQWKLEEVLEYAAHLEIELQEAHIDSTLPEKNDFEKINTLLVNIIKEYHSD